MSSLCKGSSIKPFYIVFRTCEPQFNYTSGQTIVIYHFFIFIIDKNYPFFLSADNDKRVAYSKTIEGTYTRRVIYGDKILLRERGYPDD